MRTFKRIALLTAVAAICAAVTAATASAVTVTPAGSAFTFTTGVVKFSMVGGNVSCNTATFKGSVPSTNSASVVSMTIATTFGPTPCSGPFGNATVTCAGNWTLSVGSASGSTAPTTISIPANSCTITTGVCTYTLPTSALTIADTLHLGANGSVLDDTWSFATYSYGASGLCSGGNGTISSGSGGNMAWTQAGGTTLSVS